MKRIILLSPLLLLISAAPATQPAERLIVQVRHVEYVPNPRPEPKELESASERNARLMEIPADAKDITSLQVLAAPGETFKTVAVVGGTTYQLSGKLLKPSKSLEGKSYFQVKLDYLESYAEQKGILQISSNTMLQVDNEQSIAGLMSGPKTVGLILSLKQPDANPLR